MFNYFADNEDVKHNEFYEILLETENGEVLNDYLLWARFISLFHCDSFFLAIAGIKE